MRKLIILLILLLSGCSYKIIRSYQLPEVIQHGDSCKPVAVENKNLYGLNVKYLGTVQIIAPEFSTKCDDKKAMETISQEACQIKSNLINITQKGILRNTNCNSYSADLYFTELDQIITGILNKQGRTVIKYNDVKKINWNNFEILLPDTSSAPYYFISNIELESGRSFWTGNYNNFKAQGVFYCDVSKVKRSFINENNLQHIEMLYYLTQIYSKKLERYLNSDNPDTQRREKIQDVIDRFQNDLFAEQTLYIKETNYGANIIAQQNWVEKITNEMTQLKIEK